MKILIYIPKETDSVDINHKFVSTLSRCLEKMADVNVTSKLSSPITDYDVVHVIGSWQYSGYRMILNAKRHCIPTVFSPLGGLEPWIINKSNTEKRLKAISYQRKMAETASAIHVCNKMELDFFNKLDLNKRTQLIRNSIITNEITDTEMARQMMCLYQKVMDSNCYSQIDDNAEDAIGYLLLAGMDVEGIADDTLKKEITLCLSKLTEEDWRHIFIYSHDEGITDIVIRGISNLKYNAPQINMEEIDRFPVVHKVVNTPIEREKLLSKSLLVLSRMDDIANDNEQYEKTICTIMLNIKFEIRQHNVSMLHLAELYKAVKFYNYDEDNLATMLKKAGIYIFASRLVFILKDVIGLTEGFMPINGIDDKTTDKIRKIITKLK